MERLENTDLGRVVLSAFIVVVLISLIAFAAPNGEPKNALLRPATPLLEVTGLGQGWGVFAPDPRRELLRLDAEVRNTDGSVYRWRVPMDGPFAADRDYRWRKWLEWNFLDDPAILQATAVYAARQSIRRGHQPKKVVLVRRLGHLPPPGSDAPVRWETGRAEVGFTERAAP